MLIWEGMVIFQEASEPRNVFMEKKFWNFSMLEFMQIIFKFCETPFYFHIFFP